MSSWLYLFTASMFEVMWTYSLKYIDVKKIKAIEWGSFFRETQNLLTLMPLAGYILFGICNIIFFSMAMKNIPASVAYACWTGFSLIGIKLVGIYVFRESFTFSQFFYFMLILIGIMGLRKVIS